MSKNVKIGFIILLILIVGLILSVILSRQVTKTQQHASQNVNINSSKDILVTKNNDQSMGPQTSKGNYSNKLSNDNLGSITFSITDPSASHPSFPPKIPTVTPDSNKANTTDTNSAKTIANGPQKVKSLIIQINKIEVHLKDTKSNGNVNTWETLNLQNAMSVDVAQLVDGAVVNFSLTKLAVGDYDELRVYITKAEATLENNEIIPLDIPGKNGIIRVVKDFSVEKGRNTNLVMDIDAQQSTDALQNKYLFNPYVIKIDVNK